jgi:hypothetical protein
MPHGCSLAAPISSSSRERLGHRSIATTEKYLAIHESLANQQVDGTAVATASRRSRSNSVPRIAPFRSTWNTYIAERWLAIVG